MSLTRRCLEATAWSPGDTTGGGRPQTRDRSRIPQRYRWDLSHIYSGWTEWEQDMERLEALMESYQDLRGTLAEGPERVLDACRRNDEIGKLVYTVYSYPSLMASQDTRDNAVQARVEQVRMLLARFGADTAWYTPELLAIPEERMRRWLDETPELAPYRFGIHEPYRRQEHVLDEEGERLLAYASPFGGTPAQAYTMLADADVEFPTVTLSSGEEVVASHANYTRGLRTCRQQADREALFAAHMQAYDRTANTYAAIYSGVLQRDWFLARSRRYESGLEASLDDDNVPTEVVEKLIATAMDGAEPLRRYHRLRQRALGLERYCDFDGYLPLVEVDWDVPYESVQELLVGSVAVFGRDYQDTVRRAFSERWIDVYENEGKRSGAFSAGVYGVHPYMLLNYADTLEDAFTVAHEMGHTMHTVLSFSHQPFATAEYTIFVAEVASMTSEDLFHSHLLELEDDPRRRAVLLQHAIDDICAGFYRQTLFAAYELEAHRAVERGEPVTATILQGVFLEAMRSLYGDVLDDTDAYRNTWARIPHFYGSPFYVYQYATSKAAASLLHRRMTHGDDATRRETVERFLELLRSGGSDHPIRQLARAGVDLSTDEPTRALLATMEELVDGLADELGRLGLTS